MFEKEDKKIGANQTGKKIFVLLSNYFALDHFKGGV